MNQLTLNQFKELGLKGMYNLYKHINDQPIHKHPDAHEMVALLADAEMNNKLVNRTSRLKSKSKLRYQAILADIKIDAERNITKSQMIQLGSGDYVTKAQNIIITGATGCGKTYLASALGHQACLQGTATLYLNLNNFMERIAVAKLDRTYMKFIEQLCKIKLLILDEFGIAPLNQDTKLALLQIFESRYLKASTIVIGQLPVSDWHNYINEPTMADAILDRITANSHRIELKGKSLRNQIII
jgi:DNA replication protein DnaC